MERAFPWLVSVLTGIMFVTLLNLSPFSQLGFGIDLPTGWSGTRGQYNCTGQVINNCSDCPAQHTGLPFTFNRQHKTTCFVESNNLAKLFDAFTGAGLGVLGMAYIFMVDEKRERIDLA